MTEGPGWVGLEVAGGRYQILERIGVGSMGQVYRARDRHLEIEVVIKCPIPADSDGFGPAFLSRFDFEIRSLVNLSHPHIVRVIDVGAWDDQPYVVMQYLSGGSLKDRMMAVVGGERRGLPPSALLDWLMDIAKAIDFIHDQNYIHRDIKPDNILFDRFGNAFLSDFGIIKMLVAKGEEGQSSALTAPGYLMGTPLYVAPEVVLGAPTDARIDQYSLAMTVHEMLAGSNPMESTTPSATMVNQTKIEPPALIELISGIPKGLSDAVLRGLSKNPDDRFESCVRFASEVLAGVASPVSSRLIPNVPLGTISRGIPGHVDCPVCQKALPVGREHSGKGIQCIGCKSTLRVEFVKPNAIVLNLVGAPSASWALDRPANRTVSPASGRHRNESLPGGSTGKSSVPKWLSYAMAVLIIVTFALFLRKELMSVSEEGTHRVAARPPIERSELGRSSETETEPPAAPKPPRDRVEINIAYGTEKKKWMEFALQEFSVTPQGKAIQINLVGLGSVESAMAILEEPKAGPPPHQPLHVWSPASSSFRDVLVSEWRIKHGEKSPILSAANLALTPMVFVMWKSRYDPFVKKYSKVNFETLSLAMTVSDGWGEISGKPDWGLFKFGHTDPNKSNSGLQMLVLMAHEFSRKPRGLTVNTITTNGFQDWLRAFEVGVTRHGGALTHSTGTLMEEMVLRGPSQYDCLILYENLAIDYMRQATDRWGEQGEIYVTYPDPNIWNEHPYYILDVPWSDERQRKAAAEFLKFLLSEPIQRRALEHGFRPGNSAIAISSPDSPIVRNQKFGLKIDLPVMCEPPSAEVLTTLLASFRRLGR